jgi:hypothetical protein
MLPGGRLRVFVALCIGIVVGVAMGGVPAGVRVADAMRRVEAARDCPRRDFSGVVGGMLEDAGRRNQPEPEPEPEPAPDAVSGAPPHAEPAPEIEPNDGPPELTDDQAAAARTLLEARRAQARQALIEDAGLDDDQLGTIDDAAAEMNEALLALTNDLVAEVNENGEPSRRDAMVYAADALDTLITAADRIDASLTPEQRAAADPESLDPLSYVDPAIVDAVRGLRPPRE